MVTKRLYRSKERMIGGVCGGLAEYLDIDPTVVRVAYAALTFLTVFCGILLYPVLWIIIPEQPQLLEEK